MNLQSPSEKFQFELISKTNIQVNFVHYEIVLQNTLSEQKFEFYRSIKESKRKKIFVGPERLSKIKTFLNIDQQIEVPLINAYSTYESVLNELLMETDNNNIYLFSSGMMSKSLIHKILEKNPSSTCLDLGSGLDPLIIGQTREGQLPLHIVQEYYQELL